MALAISFSQKALRAPPPIAATGGGRAARRMKRDLRVDQRERHALQHGLRQILRRRGVVEAEETRARVGIVVRGPLTGEVGQEDDPRGPGETLLDAGEQVRDVGAEEAGRPVEDARAVQHRRHLEPAAGKRMRESVDQRLRLRLVAFAGDEILRRGAERDEGVTLGNRADPDRAGRGIAGAGGDDHLVLEAPGGAGSPACSVPDAAEPSRSRGIIDGVMPLAARIGVDQARFASSR